MRGVGWGDSHRLRAAAESKTRMTVEVALWRSPGKWRIEAR